MAENKQYITQAQENGSVMISEDVIATIVEQAIAEVEGSSVKTKLGDGFCSNRWPSSPLGLRLSNNSMKH